MISGRVAAPEVSFGQPVERDGESTSESRACGVMPAHSVPPHSGNTVARIVGGVGGRTPDTWARGGSRSTRIHQRTRRRCRMRAKERRATWRRLGELGVELAVAERRKEQLLYPPAEGDREEFRIQGSGWQAIRSVAGSPTYARVPESRQSDGFVDRGTRSSTRWPWSG